MQEQFSRARAGAATVDEVKREQKLIKAKEAKERLMELETRAQADLAPVAASIPLEQLEAGDQVEIGGLGLTGTLLEVPRGKKRVRVKVGEGELLATVANLTGVGRASESRPTPAPVSMSQPAATGRVYHAEEHRVVDVRGHAADEALEHVTAALDRPLLKARRPPHHPRPWNGKTQGGTANSSERFTVCRARPPW